MSKIEHVAIIMDGNGRWANERRRPRVWGHVRGTRVVSEIVEEAANEGLKALTLYAFSTENWRRPADEIGVLFKLLKKFLIKEKNQILSNNIQFKIIGALDELSDETREIALELEKASLKNDGLILNLAFSYGGRKEIVDAVNDFIKNNPGKEIDEAAITDRLYSPEAGDVDLMIRTAGDQRISNFMLWEVSYSELFFTNTKWPDFSSKEFKQILDTVSCRERRFGGLPSDGKIESESKKNLKVVSNGN